MSRLDELAKILEQYGGLYYTGGYVRDFFYNKEPSDIDLVAFGVSFDKLKEITDDIGSNLSIGNEQNYPILCGMIEGKLVELTIPRSLSSSNSTETNPYATFEEDAMRRDFTINSLYLNVLDGAIIDPLNGLDDLENGDLIVCNNNTFLEDPRRVLRAAEMISRFGLQPNRELLILSRQCDLSSASDEVKGKCLMKILSGNDIQQAFQFLLDSDAIKIFHGLNNTIGFAQNNPHHSETLFQHLTLAAEIGSEYGIEFALAGLYHDIAKPDCMTIDSDGIAHYHGHEDLSTKFARDTLIRYGFGKEITNKVCELIQYHMRLCTSVDDITVKSIRKLHNSLKYNTLDELLTFGKVDQLSRLPEGDFHVINRIKELSDEMSETTKEFERIVTGRHLQQVFNIAEGKALGDLLRECEQAQVNGDFDNLARGLEWVGKRLDIKPQRVTVSTSITRMDIASWLIRHGYEASNENIEKAASDVREKIRNLTDGWYDD